MLSAVILGTGLLAMSGMQAIALVKNVDANELTRVTSVASDMMERIYFNRRNAVSYNGIDTKSVTNCSGISATAQPQAKGDCLLWQSVVVGTQLENVQGLVSVDLNPIEPTWLHSKRRIAEPARLLTADELAHRVCAALGCAHEPHLSLADDAA